MGLCECAKIDALVRRHVWGALVHPEVFRRPGNRGVRVLEPDREQPRVEPHLVQYGISRQLFGGVLRSLHRGEMQNAVVVDRAKKRDGYSESHQREQQSVPAQREAAAARSDNEQQRRHAAVQITRPPHFIGEEAQNGEPTHHASHREQRENSDIAMRPPGFRKRIHAQQQRRRKDKQTFVRCAEHANDIDEIRERAIDQEWPHIPERTTQWGPILTAPEHVERPNEADGHGRDSGEPNSPTPIVTELDIYEIRNGGEQDNAGGLGAYGNGATNAKQERSEVRMDGAAHEG